VLIDVAPELIARLQTRLPPVDVGEFIRYAVASAIGALDEDEQRVFGHALLLGAIDDQVLAEALEVDPRFVEELRDALALPAKVVAPEERQRRQLDQEVLALLGRPDATIAGVARGIGRSKKIVVRVMKQHGVDLTRRSPYRTVLAVAERLGHVPDTQIAKELGVSDTLVRRVRNDLGITAFQRPRELEPAVVARMLRSGMSAPEVAERLGVAKGRIYFMRKKLRIPIPKRHRST
jgi:transposase-like protein